MEVIKETPSNRHFNDNLSLEYFSFTQTIQKVYLDNIIIVNHYIQDIKRHLREFRKKKLFLGRIMDDPITVQ